MFANEQMRMGAQIMAAIFGGPGIFYIWLSFEYPNTGDAVTGIIYLSVATALALASGKDTLGEPRPARSHLARARALLRLRRRP
jgi:hypothetical protein